MIGRRTEYWNRALDISPIILTIIVVSYNKSRTKHRTGRLQYASKHKPSYHNISRSLDPARYWFLGLRSLWHLTAVPPRHLSNFRTTGSFWYPISRVRGLARFYHMTSYSFVTRGPEPGNFTTHSKIAQFCVQHYTDYGTIEVWQRNYKMVHVSPPWMSDMMCLEFKIDCSYFRCWISIWITCNISDGTISGAIWMQIFKCLILITKLEPVAQVYDLHQTNFTAVLKM